jgi:lipopolysaccharide/colanic/teichoic acid biosynthesis glycosyltransferase
MPSRRDKPTGKGNLAAVLRDLLAALELEERAKRVCDIGAAIAGLILFSPIFLITALAIKLESSGPIFVGEVQFRRDNRKIRLIKFRVATRTKDNTMGYPITRVGRMLAQSGIVELPQFINVLRGEMSMFGRRDTCRWPAPALWFEHQDD